MSLPLKRRAARGFTLIELMVALVLGLVITGAALAVFMTNRQTYAATESLGRIQENARTGYELMARDLREGAGNDCGNLSSQGQPVNQLKTPTANWYTDTTYGLIGYDNTVATPGLAFGTTTGARVTGTDAIDLHNATGDGIPILPAVGAVTYAVDTLKLNTAAHGFTSGDVVAACDPGYVEVFQLTTATSASATVEHKTSGGTPGNNSAGTYAFGCRQGNYDSSNKCDSSATWPATLSKMVARRWYVGYNDHGTKSLFRTSTTASGGVLSTRRDEIAEGVQNLQLTFLLDGGTTYDDPSTLSTANWKNGDVVAMRIVMTINDSDTSGTNRTQISRVVEHTVTFRNRTP